MEIAGIAAELLARVERETTELLSALIAIDTSNPPGNESAVAAFLDDYFRNDGLSGEICGEPAARRSFVATLRGARPGPRLVLMAHEDVVPAAAEEWAEPPFSGVVKDGYVWGRGAVDVKNLLAAFCVVMRAWSTRASSSPARSSLWPRPTKKTAPSAGRAGCARSAPTWCAATTC